MTKDETAISISHLTKRYPGFKLEDLNLDIPKGYITGFIGPNGAGKSTTIHLIMDLLKADSGRIQILGHDHSDQGKEARSKIGFVYADNVFYDDMTVKNTGKMLAPFYDKWQMDVYEDLCQRFGLDPNKKVKNLSTGMKVKLFLSVALSHDAELIILDEPTSGLDPVVRFEILDLLYQYVENGDKTVFFSSHITSDLERIADYIVMIQNGQIVFQAEKDSLLEDYRLAKGSLDLLDADVRSLFVGLDERSTGFVGLTHQTETLLELFADQILVEPASLDDIMFYYNKGGK